MWVGRTGPIGNVEGPWSVWAVATLLWFSENNKVINICLCSGLWFRDNKLRHCYNIPMKVRCGLWAQSCGLVSLRHALLTTGLFPKSIFRGSRWVLWRHWRWRLGEGCHGGGEVASVRTRPSAAGKDHFRRLCSRTLGPLDLLIGTVRFTAFWDSICMLCLYCIENKNENRKKF